MRSGSLLLSILESAALYSSLQYLLSGDLKPVIIIRLLFSHSGKVFRLTIRESLRLVALPLMCTATLPQHWGRKGFPYKTNNRPGDQKRKYYPNANFTFVPLHRFTIGARLETISHTVSKILSSVT